jgi:hypothetical protein
MSTRTCDCNPVPHRRARVCVCVCVCVRARARVFEAAQPLKRQEDNIVEYPPASLPCAYVGSSKKALVMSRSAL